MEFLNENSESACDFIQYTENISCLTLSTINIALSRQVDTDIAGCVESVHWLKYVLS
jgi:hypothetical protein